MDLVVTKIDNVYMQVECADKGTLLELRDYFTFLVPGHQYKHQSKFGWDGKIRLFNSRDHTLYIGLLHYLKEFARLFGYEITVDQALEDQNIDPVEIKKYIDALDIYKGGNKIAPRYYQSLGFYHILNKKRTTLISPTASGKSLMLYLFVHWFLKNSQSKLVLIVPTTSLVLQMQSDFSEYSQGAIDENIHVIYSGQEKDSAEHRVYITTWQSVQYLEKDYFDKFNAVIIDECQGAQASQLKAILERSQAEYRVGVTGTLQDAEAHKWVIEGLLGNVVDLISMVELMAKGWVSKLKIKCLVFEYKDKIGTKNLDYQKEIDYLISNEKRNNKILSLMGHLQENQFVLFERIAHGKYLYEKAKEMYPDRDVYLVYGITKPEEREIVRKYLEGTNNAIVVASYKVFSAGVSIDNLHHVIFAHPFKAKIRLFQSIGRSLRVHESKEHATLWDIVDKFPGKKLNITLKHFQERIQRYNEQQLPYTIQTFEL